jgi:hypothetical protein
LPGYEGVKFLEREKGGGKKEKPNPTGFPRKGEKEGFNSGSGGKSQSLIPRPEPKGSEDVQDFPRKVGIDVKGGGGRRKEEREQHPG